MLNDTNKLELGKVITEIIPDHRTLTVVTQVTLKGMKSAWTESTTA